MQVTTRHGGGSHYVRPDRVYRTGVITSTMGYDPNRDAQAVAASFTQYPMDLQVPGNMPNAVGMPIPASAPASAAASGGMSGLRGLGRVLGANNMGLLARLRNRYTSWRANRMKMSPPTFRHFQGFGDTNAVDARMTGVAYPQVGFSIMPPPFSRSDMANILMQGGHIDPGAAAAQAGLSWDIWEHARWVRS